MKTYSITTSTKTVYVCASSRSSAVSKFCGMKELAAKNCGVLTEVKKID